MAPVKIYSPPGPNNFTGGDLGYHYSSAEEDTINVYIMHCHEHKPVTHLWMRPSFCAAVQLVGVIR